MSTVLHPVGPEPPQTYWVRRAVVIGAAVLVLIVLIAIVVSQNSNGSVVANPTPSPVAVSPTAVASSPAPSATPSAHPSPTASASTKAGDPSAKASSKTSSKASAKPSASATPKKADPVACPAGDLRATLTGEQKLKPKQSNTFAISLINGSGATCKLAVTGKNFELKIYSGKDRIWSSNDCSTAVKAVTEELKSEQAVEWKMKWDGRRSKADCKERPEIPKAGTYFATAQFEGAKPIQLRMILRG